MRCASQEMTGLSTVIKGAGETASGIAHRLYTAGLTRICMLELEHPLCVRRTVSFCEAVYERQMKVEGVLGTLVQDRSGLDEAWSCRQIGVMVDPEWSIIGELKPDVVVDAILAKRNLGTRKNEAPLVIGVGPGFHAPDVVHAVIESNRGPNLGRAIYSGSAEPHTGIPATRRGRGSERVLRAPQAGTVRALKSIGDSVNEGDAVLYVGSIPVYTLINGWVRGLIREIEVAEDEKVGDIEPGARPAACRAISDKARAIGGGVLEAVMHLLNADMH